MPQTTSQEVPELSNSKVTGNTFKPVTTPNKRLPKLRLAELGYIKALSLHFGSTIMLREVVISTVLESAPSPA